MKRISYIVIILSILVFLWGCETVAEAEAKSKEVTAQADTTKESQAQTFFFWGMDYMQTKNYERALINFKRAAKESTDYVDAYLKMGEVYYKSGDYTKADSLFSYLKSKYPENTDIYRARAKMLIDMGKKEEARKEYELAIKKNEKDGLAWAGLGWFEKDAGNLEKAKEYYEKAYEYKPDNLSICFALGDVYVKLKEPKKAIDLLEKVVSDHPRSVSARNKLTQAYLDSKQYDKAIEQLEELIKLRPNSEVKYLLYEGQCYEESKQYKKAEEIYKKVIDKYPDNIGGYFALAQMYYSIGRYPEARIYANKLLKIKPNDADTYYLMANTYLMQKKFDEAIAYYKKAIKYGNKTLQKNARIGIKKAEKAKEDEEWNQSWGD